MKKHLILWLSLGAAAFSIRLSADPVPLQRATATYSQSLSGDFSASQAIDGTSNDGYGWGIQGDIRGQTAVFETTRDVGFIGGSEITFTLIQNFIPYGQHTLGRFRLSVTTDDRSTFADGLQRGGDVDANWVVLRPETYSVVNGTTLYRLDDNSILAGGISPTTDTYTVSAKTSLTGITGVRLEVLQDASLPHGGPGRQPLQGNFVLSEFLVDIRSTQPNTAPTISLPPGVGDQVVAEDGVVGPLSLVLSDAESPAAQLTLSGSSSNPALVPDGGIVFEGSGAGRTVKVFPQANQTGTARITLTVRDPGGLTGQTSFNLTVQAVNDPPLIGGVADITTTTGLKVSGVGVSVSDMDTPVGDLVVSANSSNPDLVPNSNIEVIGATVATPGLPGTRPFTMSIRPEPGRTGSARITLTVSDGVVTTETSFSFTVKANTPPRIAGLPNVQAFRDTVIGPLTVVVSDDETPDNVGLSASSSNPGLIPVSNIMVTRSGNSRSVTLTPVAGMTGSTVITLIACDGDLTGTTSFEVVVVKPNTRPVISVIPDQFAKPGVATGPIPFTIQDEETPAGQLTVLAFSSNQTLIPAGNLILGGSGTERTLDITPAAGQTGTAAVQISVSDGNLGATRQFLVTVTSAVERQVRVVSVAGAPGSTVSVVVELVALGGENAVGFSLSYDAQALSYNATSALLGGASLNVNTSRLGSGLVGVTLALPSGQTLGSGTRSLASLSFRINSAGGTFAIAFADQPVAREVASGSAAALPASYVPGTVTVLTAASYEGDAAPRPNGNGNGTVTVADWVQVGRYAAGLDVVTPGAEFQRVDCAPRASGGNLVLGNGAITVADWVQAGRYAAGLDPVTPAGGPTGQVGPASVDENVGVVLGKASVTSRTMRLVGTGEGTVAIELTGQGVEAGFGLSLSFDASKFRFDGARLADGVSGASLQVNNLESALGRVGLVLALDGGRSLAAGTTRLVSLAFTALNGETGAVTFGDAPVRREVVDTLADSLPVTYEDGVVEVPGNHQAGGLRIAQDAQGLTLSWPVGGILEQTSGLATGLWQPVGGSPVIKGGVYELHWPNSTGARFFRWRKP